MTRTLFTNAIIHPMTHESTIYRSMLVEKGHIRELYPHPFPSVSRSAGSFSLRTVDLQGRHVYPCLIDGHVHMLMTIAVMAMGFNICEITPEGVEPHDLAGIEKRLRNYAAAQKKDSIIACSNYILTAIDEGRMPTREELDRWCQGRPVVIYNIDGHSTALSTRMLEMVGISPEGHNGILQGQENERAQGRIIDKVASQITLPALARGISIFQNTCAAYGISVVGALEGNGDSPTDPSTRLITRLARHFDVGVRLYLQYANLDRVRSYRRYMKHPRVGGCGDWEMDGSIGSHSAAFHTPFLDTGQTAPCYYSQESVNALTRQAQLEGYQMASHAIGAAAIERLLAAYRQLPTSDQHLHRIEHCEFMTDDSFHEIAQGHYAIMMQPGYAWIDKRYLHTYERALPREVLDRMKLRSLYDAGVCLCGSSDSPVQDLDPYLQMLGMVDFYKEDESLTPYQALRCYTAHAARSIAEEKERGTLEAGKVADFFTADQDFFALTAEELLAFRPHQTWYGGKLYCKKMESVGELLQMLLTPSRKI